MSKNFRLTLTILTATAIGAGGIAAIAQTITSDMPTAPALAGERDGDLVRADFRGGRQFGGRRGGRGGMMMRVLAQADANSDGSITQDEIDAYRAAQLESADADSDGAIALDEFQTIFLEQTRPMMVDAFQALDADGDGSVTTAELDERFGSIVERFDRNDDGALSAEDRGRRGRGEGRGRRDRD